MSCFEFVKAGTTGSYGTVVEPFAFQQKFPIRACSSRATSAARR